MKQGWRLRYSAVWMSTLRNSSGVPYFHPILSILQAPSGKWKLELMLCSRQHQIATSPTPTEWLSGTGVFRNHMFLPAYPWFLNRVSSQLKPTPITFHSLSSSLPGYISSWKCMKFKLFSHSTRQAQGHVWWMSLPHWCQVFKCQLSLDAFSKRTSIS